MLFRNRRSRDDRAEAWSAVAGRLGLVAVDGGEELLEKLIAPEPGELTGGVWRVAGGDNPEVYVFERRSGPDGDLLASTLLTDSCGLGTVPVRVTRRLRAQLATFQASASQASLVTTGDSLFDESVTVMARRTDEAGRMLTEAMRAALMRLILRGARPPVLVISESSVLVTASLAAPAEVELLITDVMAVYAALVASASG